VKLISTVLPLSFCLAAGLLHAADWPQWRGPNRDGSLPGESWPDKLTGHLEKLWTLPLGPGYSGPVISGGKVFTTETVNKKTEIVRCLDSATGRELWRREWPGAMGVPFFAKANGDWIRATPACDGERLYVAGMRDVLVCLNAADGTEVWRMDFVNQLGTPLPSFGFVSSPLLDGDAVYVQAGAAVVKLDKLTGGVLWRAAKDDGGMWGSAFSSPVMATLAGRKQLIALTREKFVGLDPADGQVLWEQKVEAFRGMNILTPVVSGDTILTAAYGGRTHLFRVEETGGKFRVSEAWNQKQQGYMSTPVIVDGHAWLHLRNQRVCCLDLKDGSERWTTGKSYGKYWSLVTNGSRILALDQNGSLMLINATPERFDLMDTVKVSGKETWAHLGVSGDRLFIRDLAGLTAWRWAANAATASRVP
jgi:outer membrane protein assembly factor BamB